MFEKYKKIKYPDFQAMTLNSISPVGIPQILFIAVTWSVTKEQVFPKTIQDGCCFPMNSFPNYVYIAINKSESYTSLAIFVVYCFSCLGECSQHFCN